MKKWLEATLIAAEIDRLTASGGRAALATVVRVRGSAYRRPGARLLVCSDGRTVGNVSGGCLEEDVREVALRVIESGLAERRSYCSGSDEIHAWDLGVGCEGEVEVYVQRVENWGGSLHDALAGDAPFTFCMSCAAGNAPRGGGLAVRVEGTSGTLGNSALDAMVEGAVRLLPEGSPPGLHRIGDQEVFLDRFTPPPRLLVFGAGEDARPLVRLALDVGFRVTVIDRRPAALAPQRFPRAAHLVLAPGARLTGPLPVGEDTFALLMTHSFADDLAYASALAGEPLRYLGILGPRARTERLLGAAGLEALLDDPRLHGPVGLDIGTEGAEQVALSILAELLAVRSGRSGEPLRDRCTPIHGVGD